MRYAIFSDIHANLEALEAVLAKIDELAQEEPIEKIWFLGDLVGYGPDPNQCIVKLRERTDVIIAGNHDWAAVGKIDLEDFSAAARISAEWTAEELTEEHRAFLINLPERFEIGECTLVHGSPYGPLWEYLTSEALAERSFQYFNSRFCLVGHTHVPVIFQQPDTFSNAPTLPLQSDAPAQAFQKSNGFERHVDEDDEETEEMVAVQISIQQTTHSAVGDNSMDSAFKEPEGIKQVEDAAVENISTEIDEIQSSKEQPAHVSLESGGVEQDVTGAIESGSPSEVENAAIEEVDNTQSNEVSLSENTDGVATEQADSDADVDFEQEKIDDSNELEKAEGQELIENHEEDPEAIEIILDTVIADSDDRLNGEIEELLTLLGLSQSMIKVTNEMITPPEGLWQAEDGYRAIINPGGVGQPRDGDPRAAFMIYDTEQGFEFYRVPYDIEKTQKKILEAGLPHYLAVRLEYGR